MHLDGITISMWFVFSALWILVGMLLEANTHMIDRTAKWAAEKIEQAKKK